MTGSEEMFYEMGLNHDFEIDTLEVAQEHVHIFLSFPPILYIEGNSNTEEYKRERTISRTPGSEKGSYGERNSGKMAALYEQKRIQ